MRVEEATKSVGGRPVRIYATDGGGKTPIHGAYWDIIWERWRVTEWTRAGHNCANNTLNLNLHDWRDEIPWSCLRPGIVAVARDKDEQWWGYEYLPCKEDIHWDKGIHKCKAWSLEGFYIPSAPSDWTQTLAIRPGHQKQDSHQSRMTNPDEVEPQGDTTVYP